MVGEKYANNAFLSIFAGAFTPIPYKALTISAGRFSISLHVLFFASILGIGGRFFVVVVALKFFGKKIQNTIGKYFNVLLMIFLVLLIAGFLVLKYNGNGFSHIRSSLIGTLKTNSIVLKSIMLGTWQ
ncbi:MAG: hypothetical protein LE178_02145 [Endomicrobium sp.]|nr:hypothetical protein [Endomicrobium sp.]